MAGSLQQSWASLGIPADYAKSRLMPLQREATRLVSIGKKSNGQVIELVPRAAGAWHRMQIAASERNIKLMPLSGFRSVARQTEIIRKKLSAGTPIREILQFIAAPGCSEHHTGRALDLGSPASRPLDESFAQTVEYRWLRQHAAEFGFQLSYPRGNSHGIGYEPWHWCWHPCALVNCGRQSQFASGWNAPPAFCPPPKRLMRRRK